MMTARLQTTASRYTCADEGATAAEYAILASAIAALIVVVVSALGVQVVALFQSAIAALGAALGL